MSRSYSLPPLDPPPLINTRDQAYFLDMVRGFELKDRPDLPGLRAPDASRLRYESNPATCTHRRKTYRYSVWRCSDCGVRA